MRYFRGRGLMTYMVADAAVRSGAWGSFWKFVGAGLLIAAAWKGFVWVYLTVGQFWLVAFGVSLMAISLGCRVAGRKQQAGWSIKKPWWRLW